MLTPRRALAALVAHALLLGCSAGTARRDNPAEPAAASPAVTGRGCDGRQPTEPMLAVTGADPHNAVLRPLTFCPTGLGPQIGPPRISWVSAGGGVVAVAEASDPGSPRDRLGLIENGAVRPIPGLGQPPGQAPNVGPDGRMLFTLVTGPTTFLIRMHDPATRHSSTVLRRREQTSPAAWGPDGRIAVIERLFTNPRLLLLDGPAAKPVAVDVTLSTTAIDVAWSANGDLLIRNGPKGDRVEPATIISEHGHVRGTVPAGWTALAFTPDGMSLLVTRGDTGELALLRGPDYDDPLDLGRVTDGPVYGVAFTT